MISRFAFMVLFLMLAVGAANAETITASVPLSPANEVPPITNLVASGAFQITVEVTRNAAGAITGGTVQFLGNFAFPDAVTVTGLHIHKGTAVTTGLVRFDTGISGTTPMVFPTGDGFINLTATVNADNLEDFKLMVANPAGFYVNLHTSVNGGGALRGQMVKFEESSSITVNMTTAAEFPPVPAGVTASGVGTIKISPVRNPATGAVTGGTVRFSMNYDLPVNSTIVGLHIHEGLVGVAGPVVINTGINATNNSISLPTGKGSLAIDVPTSGASFAAMQRLIANPAGFYVNLHTSDFGAGIIRAQLTAPGAAPVIQSSSTYFLPTGTADETVTLTLTGVDATSAVLINGVAATVVPDPIAGTAALTISAADLANEGTLWVQARNGAGVLSNLVGIVVSNNVNPIAATITDAAKYGPSVAPESIAAGFGTSLSSTTVVGQTTPLPVQLDGTKVYINGVFAPLFAVTQTQVNFIVPPGTLTGPASIVITNKDGITSRGTVSVASTSPAIFTIRGNGAGAPAAVATKDGLTYTSIGAPDGSPVPIDAGSVIVLFGTGLRFSSTAATATVGGDPATVAFIGAQGSLIGVDQINIPIPAAMAGKGAVDLVVTVENKATNAVRVNIR